MFTIQEIKTHYLFSNEEADTLRSLLPIAEMSRERMIDEFYDYLLGIPETAAFLQDAALYGFIIFYVSCIVMT